MKDNNTENKEVEIKSVTPSEVLMPNEKGGELFTVDNLITTSNNSAEERLHDHNTMTSPFMRSCFILQNHGAHYDPTTGQFRVYDTRTGLWNKYTTDGFRYVFSNIFNKENNKSRGEAKIVPMSKLDDIWYQILLGNKIGVKWATDNETYHYKLPFANGVLNLKTRVKEKFYKELMLESKLERNYEPEAGTDCPYWNQLLDNLSNNDARVKRVLEAFALLSMTGKGRLERSILSLYSEIGGSGKGTYINVLQSLAGPDRTATSEISALTDDTSLSEFDSKTLLVFPEEREVLRSSTNSYARILKLASMDTLTGRVVYSREIFRFIPKAVMVFSSNYHIFPHDGAGARRILMLKTYNLEMRKQDTNFGLYLEKELPRITNRLLEIFDWNPEMAADVIKEAAFYTVFMEFAKENSIEVSTVASFLNTMVIPVCAINNERPLSATEYNKNAKDYKKQPIPAINSLNLYKAYKNFIADRNPGAKPLKEPKFLKEVISYYRINLGHYVHLTNEAVPNLKGAPQRILGITPNTENWIDEYNMFKQ